MHVRCGTKGKSRKYIIKRGLHIFKRLKARYSWAKDINGYRDSQTKRPFNLHNT